MSAVPTSIGAAVPTATNAAAPTPSAAGYSSWPITPSDTANLPRIADSLYVGVAGNVRLIAVDGEDTTFQNLAAGSILPIRALKVWATGTTATGLVGLNQSS